MIVCWKCGNVYETPRVVLPTRNTPGAALCPACGAPFDGEWAKKCNLCGEWKHPANMTSRNCCNDCAGAAASDEAQFKKFLEDEQIEDEFFVDYVLTMEERIAAGKAKFAKMSKAERMENIKGFLSGETLFAEWLEEQA